MFKTDDWVLWRERIQILREGMLMIEHENAWPVLADQVALKLRKLEVVKQEMGRVNTDILGFSELKWTAMGNLNSDYHYVYYYGQESLRRNGVAIIVNKRVWNAVLGCNLKKKKEWSLFVSKANHSKSQ